jgi:AcrR family transcriptional regulator
MKVSREQVAEHRLQILAAAARLFRLRGFEAVTVAEVMKDAGLTHGAFYGYFPSKEALIAEAVAGALPPVPDRGKPQRSAAEYADLSQRQAPPQPGYLLSMFKSGNGSRARLSRTPTQHDGGRPSPDRSSQCRGKE